VVGLEGLEPSHRIRHRRPVHCDLHRPYQQPVADTGDTR
jgi:hypothetical protein